MKIMNKKYSKEKIHLFLKIKLIIINIKKFWEKLAEHAQS
jgi:hypothetical protein